MEKSKKLYFILSNPIHIVLESDAIFDTNYHISLVKLSTFFFSPVPHPNSDSSFLKSVLDFFCPFSCLIFYMPRIPCRPLLCSWYMLCLTDFIHSLLPFKDSLNANDPRF